MYTPPRSLAEAQQQQCHHCPWCSGMLGAWRRRRKRARRVLGWRLLLAIAMVAVMWMMLSLFAALSCINIVCVCVCVCVCVFGVLRVCSTLAQCRHTYRERERVCVYVCV